MLPTAALAQGIGAQVMERARILAQQSDSPHCLTRSYLTPAHHGAAEQLAQWMRDAGMQVRRDAAANVIGRYEAHTANAPALLTGSHFDTVVDAGRYDGTLGILLPIACIAAWHRAGQRFAFALEVIAFAEEEGVRFNATLLGSRAAAGSFDLAVLDKRDAAGQSMREVLTAAGFDPQALGQAARDPASVLGFIEVHIEQGPVLLDAGLALGVVTAIAGASRFQLEVTGQAGHAGTVPMALRRDAAMAAAEIALYVEQRCGAEEGLVGTVGQIAVPGGAANVVPGKATLSIDIRAADDATRQLAVADVLAQIGRIAQRRAVEVQVHPTHEAASVACAGWLQQQWASALERCGQPHRFLASGAGHDAMAMAALTDVAMLFVRCGNGGISHSPLETMSAPDAEVAAQAFADFVSHFEVQP